jgi:glycosyltransferase involved in cell wall biosynthesis
MDKIKIVWICHFSNSEVRKRLPLSTFWFINFLKRITGKGARFTHKDFAPWITQLLSEFEKTNEVELHIISPHRGLNRFMYSFNLNDIHYHFFKPELPLHFDRIAQKIFNRKNTTFRLNRYFVKNFIKKIKPDVVNLFGAENPYYSITALDIKEVPVYVLLQTVLATPFMKTHNFNVDTYRLEIEEKILKSANYFGTAGKLYHDCVMDKNLGANVLEFWFPTQIPPLLPDQLKEFDFCFFASGVSQLKGIEDAIDALSIVAQSNSKAKMNIIGSCNSAYKTYLQNKITSLGLEGNIEFSNHFPVHADMFKQVKKSKMAVLPNKLDVISSTIREAMFLEVPVVTTITTGTPFLNKGSQTVLLSEIGDIKTLAHNMIELLNNPELSDFLVKNAKKLAEEIFDNNAIAHKLIEDNKAIINHFNNGVPIPEALLFNVSNYPEYRYTAF